MSLVYSIKNNVNGKCYIGKTIQELNKRISKHLRLAKNKSKLHLHNAIRKYGWENFSYFAWHVSVSNDEEILNRFEINKIKEFNTFNNGYNMTTGGGGGFGSGKNSPWYGKTFSKGHKKKLSESKSGKNNYWYNKKNPKHSKRMSGENHPMYGKKNPEQSERMKGKNNPMYGISGKNAPNAKSIILIHPNEKEERFYCIMDACRKYNLQHSNLSMILNGKRKRHKNFKCKYMEGN